MTDKNEFEINYYYSASTNMFYPEVLKQDYIKADSFPEDAKPVEDSVYQEFVANYPPEGKMRIAGEDGMPAWADFPPPTQEELIQQAEYEKRKRSQEAARVIAPLQDAVDLGIATGDEVKRLNAWKEYRVQVNRIDTTTAPDIAWPPKPG